MSGDYCLLGNNRGTRVYSRFYSLFRLSAAASSMIVPPYSLPDSTQTTLQTSLQIQARLQTIQLYHLLPKHRPKLSATTLLFSRIIVVIVVSRHQLAYLKDLTHTITNSGIHFSSISPPNDHESHTILGSSNGLLLSVSQYPSKRKYSRFGLCFFNPLTKQCIQLPTLSSNFFELEFSFATRRGQDSSTFLTYKIVIVRCDPKSFQYVADTTIDIFSLDTGSWAGWLVSCPGIVLGHAPWREGFAYRGILHWLDRKTGTIVTYDPFDSPDRFGRIKLPKEKYSDSCLLYSGEQEMLKYCGRDGDVFDKLWVWRLVDYDKGKWCLEREVRVPYLHTRHMGLMVAPNPWLICRPFWDEYPEGGYVAVIDLREMMWRYVKVFSENRWREAYERSGVMYPLVFVELCPWSSPFYSQS